MAAEAEPALSLTSAEAFEVEPVFWTAFAEAFDVELEPRTAPQRLREAARRADALGDGALQ